YSARLLALLAVRSPRRGLRRHTRRTTPTGHLTWWYVRPQQVERWIPLMQRLSPLDAMFLQQDSPTMPRQVASLAILEPGAELDYDRLVHVINARIDIVPRYRQVPRH